MDTKSYKVDVKASRTVETLSLELNVYRERRKLTSVAKKVESDFEAVLLTNEKHQLNRGVLWPTPKAANQAAPKTIEQRLVLAGDLTDLSGTFANLISLEYADISTWDTSKVVNFYLLFGGCTSLKRIDGIIDLSSVKQVEDRNFEGNSPISGMLWDCDALEQKVVIKNPPSDYLELMTGDLFGRTKWEAYTNIPLDKCEFVFG